MSNILIIDKPKRWTSFDVIRHLRKKIGVRKMGHAGTLDPLATGVLIVALDKATKRINEFMNLPKTYEALIEFGKVSTTYDADGEVAPVEGAHAVSRGKFDEAIKNFVGEIQQVPPAFSAVRVKGRRAYDLARAGEPVVLKPRSVFVKKIEILSWNWPEVSLRIECGKGTYIRSIAHDLGQRLGCGGYIKELRRTRIGEYKVEDATTIE